MLDKPLSDFLDPVNGNLNPASDFVLLAGDHGWNYGPFMRTLPGYLDRRLPLFAMLAPRPFLRRSQIDGLSFNQQSLVTVDDIAVSLRLIPLLRRAAHQTDRAADAYRWLSPQQAQYGRSLLSRIDRDRQCDDAGVPDSECALRHLSNEGFVYQIDKWREACLGKALLDEITRRVLEQQDATTEHCTAFSGEKGWKVSSFNVPSGFEHPFIDQPIDESDTHTYEYMRRVAQDEGNAPAAIYVIVTLNSDVTSMGEEALTFGGQWEPSMKFSEVKRLSRYSHEPCHTLIPRSIRPLCVCKTTIRADSWTEGNPGSLGKLCAQQ